MVSSPSKTAQGVSGVHHMGAADEPATLPLPVTAARDDSSLSLICGFLGISLVKPAVQMPDVVLAVLVSSASGRLRWAAKCANLECTTERHKAGQYTAP